ncbi:MAG: DUF3078 domain-containing protein [Flavobacteriaceae bacterium]|nr:DUF3078 domain-containing protein [Bacteroidia bacterium]NNL16169.1 DUF3078 domain-containing protein [Flavobacteriaceae bacterium]
MRFRIVLILSLFYKIGYSQFLDINTIKLDSISKAQTDQKWIQSNMVRLDFSEVAFVNWNAGGTNSISALLNVFSSIKYNQNNLAWLTSVRARYGINDQENQQLRKTEDEIELNSTLGFRENNITNWYYSARFNFKTQFSNGYNYPDRDNAISKFMAPGYLFFGGGAEYGKNLEQLSLYLSPLTFKSTFVLDEDLANAGAFGVTAAVIDENGNIIERGKRVRTEMGILVTNSYQTKLFENIALTNRLSLYTDYLNSFGNIDIDWEVILDFRVNSFVKATFGTHIRYDNDVKILEETEIEDEFIEKGARVQLKQFLGIGVEVKF